MNFNTRSEIKRLAMQSPEKLTDVVWELKEENERLKASIEFYKDVIQRHRALRLAKVEFKKRLNGFG